MTMEHLVKLNCLNMHGNIFIGHGVVLEGNRKMTGCLQTFGGHCIQSVEKLNKTLNK